MAEEFRRQVVNDPLASNPRENTPARQFQMQNVYNPRQTGGKAGEQSYEMNRTITDRIKGAVGVVMENQVKDAQAEGKIAYMSGVAEADILRQGNRYTRQGYEMLRSVDTANKMLIEEDQFIATSGKNMTPEEYQKRIMDRRKQVFESLPDDPAVRDAYIAAYDDVGPKLAAAHMKASNDYNKEQTYNSGVGLLMSTASTASDASQPASNSLSFRVSDTAVGPSLQYSNQMERDILIKTVLGEAAGENDQGMAMVAHTIKNRAMDGAGKWPQSLQGVAQQAWQYSTWNKDAKMGGNNPHKWKPGTAIYERAAKIVDAVIEGKHVDPTGGMTHYYSAGGMQKLKADGAQSHLIPKWWGQESAKGSMTHGNHMFAGKSAMKAKGIVGAAMGTVSGPTVANAAAQGSKDSRVDVQYDPATYNPGIVGGTTPDGERQQLLGNTEVKGTSVQNILGSINAGNDVKAAMLTDAIVMSLDGENGSDALFNDAGGYGILTGLGASPEMLHKVKKAKESYDQKARTKFDADYERESSELTRRASKGEFGSVQEAEAAAMALNDKFQKNDEYRRSLFTSVINAHNTQQDNDDKRIPVEMRTSLAAIWEGLEGGVYDTPEEAANAISALAKEHGIDPDVLNNLQAEAYRRAEQDTSDKKRAAATAAEKAAKSDRLKASALNSLGGRGKTLSELKGNVIDENGQEITVEEWGIKQIREDALAAAQATMKGVAPEDREQAQLQAEADMDRAVYTTLKKQNVIDKQAANQYAATILTGLDKDGKPSQDQERVLDWYLRMKNDPQIGDDYISGMFNNHAAGNQIRTILTAAAGMENGRANLSEALGYGYSQWEPSMDTGGRSALSAGLEGKTMDQVRGSLREALGENLFKHGWSFWPEKTGDQHLTEIITDMQSERGYIWDTKNAIPSDEEFFKSQRPAIENSVLAGAYKYKMENPRVSYGTAVEMSMQDFKRDAFVIAGNITTATGDQRIDRVMNLDGAAKDGADKRGPELAINHFVATAGADRFGPLYDEMMNSSKGFHRRINPLRREPTPDYNAVYHPNTGMIHVQLWAVDEHGNPDRNKTVGPTVMVKAEAVGRKYKEALAKPSYLGTIYNKLIKEPLGSLAPKDDEERRQRQRTLGGGMGGAPLL